MTGHEAVAQFCSALGLPPQGAPVSMQFERSGRLQIEPREDGFVVLLARPAPPYLHGVAARALRLVHPDRALPFPVKAAFRGDDTLVMLARIAAVDLDLPTLERLVALLASLAADATDGTE